MIRKENNTYGKNMLKSERNSEHDSWLKLLYKSLYKRDYDRFSELIKEGIEEGYLIPSFEDDPIAARIIDKIFN